MIGSLIGKSEEDIYKARKSLDVDFEYNEVDTCSAEFKTLTPYLYSTTNITKLPKLQKQNLLIKKVMIIGGGPNRIGQGIEFDYCCVHLSFVLNEMGVKQLCITVILKLYLLIMIHQIFYTLNLLILNM